MTDDNKKNNPGIPAGYSQIYGPFVTTEDCKNVSGKILGSVEQMSSDIGKIKESLYGIEKAGKVEGGLVNMISSIYNNKKLKISGREKALIVVATITGICGLVATIIQCIL